MSMFIKKQKMLLETSFSSGRTMSFPVLTLRASMARLTPVTSQTCSLTHTMPSAWWWLIGQEKTAPHSPKALRHKVGINILSTQKIL